MKTNDLEERIIDFAVLIINLVAELKNDYSGNYYGNQLIRSSGSPALNYGEQEVRNLIKILFIKWEFL